MKDIFESEDYKRSRSAYVIQCTVEYFISILVADAFLAKLLKSVGLNDSLIGVISSLVSFSFLIQLLSIILMKRIRNIKRNVVVYDTVSMLFFLCTYLVPFLKVPQGLKTVLVFVCILGGFSCKYLVSGVCYRWANAFVDPEKRGNFSATKEMISLASGILFTLGIGFVVDRYEAKGNLAGSFIFIAAVMFVITVLDFVSLLAIRDADASDSEKQHKSLREVITATFGNRSFVCLMITRCLWSVACYITTGFLGTYKTQELFFTVGAVQLINMAGSAARFILSKPFGHYSDRTSFAKGFRLALCIAGAGFLCIIFTKPETRFMIIAYTVLYNVSMAGINANSTNMIYSYVPSDCFVQASAIIASIGGLLGFGASLLGGRILTIVQENGNTVFGLPVYGQQILGGISFILTVVTMLFTCFVLEKQKVMKQ